MIEVQKTYKTNQIRVWIYCQIVVLRWIWRFAK